MSVVRLLKGFTGFLFSPTIEKRGIFDSFGRSINMSLNFIDRTLSYKRVSYRAQSNDFRYRFPHLDKWSNRSVIMSNSDA